MTLHAGMNCQCGSAGTVSVLRLEIALLQQLAGLLMNGDANGVMAMLIEYPHLKNLAQTNDTKETE